MHHSGESNYCCGRKFPKTTQMSTQKLFAYRPTCLLDFMGKMLEIIIYNKNELAGDLSDRQYM